MPRLIPAAERAHSPGNGRSNEEIIHALHQFEGGEKVTKMAAAPCSRWRMRSSKGSTGGCATNA